MATLRRRRILRHPSLQQVANAAPSAIHRTEARRVRPRSPVVLLFAYVLGVAPAMIIERTRPILVRNSHAS